MNFNEELEKLNEFKESLINIISLLKNKHLANKEFHTDFYNFQSACLKNCLYSLEQEIYETEILKENNNA